MPCASQILTPRKLYILHGKVAVFPSNAISLEEATPRFDDAKGTIHLDVSVASPRLPFVLITPGVLSSCLQCHPHRQPCL
jgi:hypothetical protein